MTQLPEVEVVRKDLEKEVVGKRFKELDVKAASVVARHRNRPEFYKALEGQKVEGVTRRGTYLVLALDNGTSLVVKLGPQGLLTRETATEQASRHTQLVATFTTGGALHLVDPEGNSGLFVVPDDQLAELDEFRRGGIDPLSDTFTWPAFGTQLTSRQTRLKKLLVDPSFIVGLGDLYSDEILWTAGLSGSRISNTLSSQEVRRLYRAVQEVLFEAVKQGGTSEGAQGEHTDLFGEPGDYGAYIKVYDREGQPCPRCRRPIRYERLETDLHSYHCTGCQT